MSIGQLSSIGQSIEILCNEQGLDRDLIIEAMKDAVKAAARKQFKDKTGDSVQVDWNSEEGIVEISAQKTVVEVVEDPLSELSLEEAVELVAPKCCRADEHGEDGNDDVAADERVSRDA